MPDEQATRRVRFLARAIFAWAFLVVLRLLQLQVLQHDDYLAQAQAQQERTVEIRAPRGAILDRLGQKLALSLPVDSVCVNPMRVPDPGVAAGLLAPILDVNPVMIEAKIRLAARERRGFLWIKRKITPEESQRLRSLKLEYVEFRTESRRFYPYKTLAAHVVGGVGFDERGNAGIEQSMNEDLEGHAGEMRVTTDVQQHGYDSKVAAEAQAGRDLRLTIDSRIQYIAERELKNTVTEHHCKTGSLVAMNPYTGEILAMASYPTYDPNEQLKPGSDVSAHANQAISVPFEPGSVFKVITISSALETTNIKPTTTVSCGNGSIRLFGRVIHDHGHYSSLMVEDVLARSSNIGAINIGLQVGKENLYNYVRRFGFGRPAGIRLPGESAGLVRKPRFWQPSSIGSVAMGHEVLVTTLQLAQACSVIANGGLYVRPRILIETPQEAPVRVLKPETAITMRQMMEGVVIKPWGTGKKARIAGYTSGGKTGTAQIVDLKTHTYTHSYNASFMGFAPVTNPKIVVVTTVNGATGLAGYGGEASAPVFREVAAASMRLLDVPRDLPDEQPADDGGPAPSDLAIAGLNGAPDLVTPEDEPPAEGGAGTLVAPLPLPSQMMQQVALGPKVPDFRGRSKRAVAQQCSAQGIPVEFIGSGMALAQYPPAGVPLPPGQRLRVQFGR